MVSEISGRNHKHRGQNARRLDPRPSDALALAGEERRKYVHAATPDAEITGKVLAMLDDMERGADSDPLPEFAHSINPAADPACSALPPHLSSRLKWILFAGLVFYPAVPSNR